MIKTIFSILFGLIVSLAFAQNQDDVKLTKKEKRKAEMEQKYQLTKQMLEDKNFVLESDFLQDKYGNRIPVSSTINFVMVSDSTGVIQVGSNYGAGANGVGGVTAKGRITKWELDANEKKKTFDLNMTVMSTIGVYDVHFWINPHGQARARLTGLTAGNLTFDGDIVALQNSGVYEGQSY